MKRILATILLLCFTSSAFAQVLPNPCDDDPDSPCNRNIPTPTWALCPDLSYPDPVCVALCQAAFRNTVDAAQLQACATMSGACQDYLNAISNCDDAFDDCVNGGGSNCTSRFVDCTDRAQSVLDAATDAADATLNYAVAKATQDFYDCARDCCGQEFNAAPAPTPSEDFSVLLCSTDPPSPCGYTIEQPFFECAQGEINPGCAAACMANYISEATAAQDAACSSWESTCVWYENVLGLLETQLVNCVEDGGDPDECAERYLEGLDDLRNKKAEFDGSVLSEFEVATELAAHHYLACMADCCEEN